jgi:hypothetical protein
MTVVGKYKTIGKIVTISFFLAVTLEKSTRIVPATKIGTPKINSQKLTTQATKLIKISVSPNKYLLSFILSHR